MSEKELLEAVAKVIGFGDSESGRVCWTESEYPRGSGKHGALWNFHGYMDTAELWNPLSSDADLYRLMRDLGMRVDFHYRWVVAGGVTIEWSANESAALTIVRAAAQMPNS